MTLRIGVIGTGAIGQEHIERLSHKLIGAQVVAVNDIHEETAKAAVARLGIQAKFYADPHALIKSDDVDALVVTSWGPTHEEFVLASIAAGKPVFCEKPLAVTAQGCKNIVDAEIKHGKRLVQVGFMRPFDLTYRQLKATLDNGEIGQPLLLNCKHFNPEVGESYTTPMAIVDTLIHELDVLRWLLDDDYVSARVIYPRKTSKASNHLADPQVVILETAKGIVINTQIFVNCQYGYDIQCEVVGEQGIAYLPEPNQVTIRKNAHVQRGILMDWKKRFIEAYDVELQAFINNATSGNFTSGASAWDGYAAAVAADACVKAQQTGNIEPIVMPAMPIFYNK
ncbi:Gfo/Idh/MocA family protein [Conservatibacter flavescens]|uniref:Inositol 2-dehydrogenase n=1 Tax=Conservatibacter flavescens TaxID=28161 RepID=A0A2M8S4R0_9PAST|nr:Gfo/Idh/MocA family oxidoreductase [Conservatibacter flavescens]PJG86130.1 inositol 2-dehydrogenase [Conservatibacter flavescens]